ncbi:hypothetical protein MYX77_00835 [Acidobacteriia bacterium AH_259_A11_L15]|nr:hypothetical protein [Acidobacteriia bacterium AH_259_A11_L15]
MARAIWAFLAFNVYSLFLISVFQENTPHLFDAKLVAEMRAAGEIFDIKAWGWKDHYIWRLFSGVVVTAVAAFLAGAIARRNGAKVAVIANVPSIILWAALFYLLAFGRTEVEGQTGFIVVSIVAIPLTTWIAYQFGKVGAETQASEFQDSTVLGIGPYHWVWIVFPLYLYARDIVFVVAKFFALQFLTWRDMSMVGALISFLALIPVIAWIAPIVMTYNVLTGESLSDKSPGVRGLANAGIIIGGALLASGIEIACFWLLQKLMSWWYT